MQPEPPQGAKRGVCGKIIFHSKIDATLSAMIQHKLHGYIHHAYECVACGGWHLTSKVPYLGRWGVVLGDLHFRNGAVLTVSVGKGVVRMRKTDPATGKVSWCAKAGDGLDPAFIEDAVVGFTGVGRWFIRRGLKKLLSTI